MKNEQSFLSYTPHCSEDELVQVLESLYLLTPMVRAALDLAKEVHSSQGRDDGTPYLEEHVYPITAAVAQYSKEDTAASGRMPDPEMAVATALLHDVLEDSTTVTREDIEKKTSPEVAEAVSFLTKPSVPGHISRIERERLYFSNLGSAPNWVKTIKLFDRLNNLECIHKSSVSKRQRYLQETLLFHLPMAEGIDQGIVSRMRAMISKLQAFDNK